MRPPDGVLKLNVDGTFMPQSGRAGAGMILRRCDGSTVFSACRNLVLCSSALEAELQACLEGIQFALDICQEPFVVESDSAELVQMIKSKERDSSTLGHLVEDLRMLFLSGRIVSC